jgi:regulator of chromosome condensation
MLFNQFVIHNPCMVREKRSTSSQAGQRTKKQKAFAFFPEQIKWPVETAVLIYGSGECAQLGMGEDVTSLMKPRMLKALPPSVKVTAGGLHSLALSADGKIYSWGCNDEKALGHREPEFQIGCVDFKHFGQEAQPFFVDIACGDSISAGITQQGLLYAWGTFRDSRGVLGFSPSVEICEIPTHIPLEKGLQACKVFAGANHLVVLDSNGEAWTWGCGEQGQLGRRVGERHRMLALKPLHLRPSARGCRFVSFALGAYHSMGCTAEGSVWAWGLNNYGQLGLGDLEARCNPCLLPEQDFAGEKIVALAAGEHHSMALSSEGRVWCFGRGDSGQLGVASSQEIEHSSRPVAVQFAEAECRIVAIAAGSNHCLAVDSRGAAWTWGYGDMGQLGLGREDNEPVPVKMQNLPMRVLQVTAGGHHSMMLVEKPESK